MQSVAQGWLVLKLTNSALMLGVVSFAGYLPVLLVTLFAGVIVDHADRRRLIVTTQVLLMLSAFILAALTWAGVVRVEYVIILAAINGLVTAFDMPARQTFVVEMVGREDLPNAIALNSMIFNGARVVGPAVAGVLISVIGIAGCFFLNGLSYIAVIWSLLEMELVARELPRIGSAMFTRLREGFDYIWHHRASFYLLLLIAINAGLWDAVLGADSGLRARRAARRPPRLRLSARRPGRGRVARRLRAGLIQDAAWAAL